MNDLFNKPFKLHNPIQHYKWGPIPPDAFIPQLIGIEGKKKPYAELWIGAHPSGSSKLKVEDRWLSLRDIIQRFPDLILGRKVAVKFENKLPFLFKVLSANEPLSIQTHPTKGQAELLHNNDPDHYPDNNHKPEIAIALDELTALAGFRKYNQCKDVITEYPEIAKFMGKEALLTIFPDGRLTSKQQTSKIRELYHTLVHLNHTKPSSYKQNVTLMAERLKSQSDTLTAYDTLFLNGLDKYGKTDIGLFTVFFLKMIHLKPGEAICIPPGIPHAYLKGNIVECMANSDNVVRAGLTPKFQDTGTLMTVLNYTPDSISITKPVQIQNDAEYPVFTPEFKVSRIELTNETRVFQTGNQIEIFLITDGCGKLSSGKNYRKNILRGHSYMIPGILDNYTISTKSNLSLFRAQIP